MNRWNEWKTKRESCLCPSTDHRHLVIVGCKPIVFTHPAKRSCIPLGLSGLFVACLPWIKLTLGKKPSYTQICFHSLQLICSFNHHKIQITFQVLWDCGTTFSPVFSPPDNLTDKWIPIWETGLVGKNQQQCLFWRNLKNSENIHLRIFSASKKRTIPTLSHTETIFTHSRPNGYESFYHIFSFLKQCSDQNNDELSTLTISVWHM